MNLTDAKLRKIVAWVAKIAILIISAPATVSMISRYYHTNSPVVLVLVQVAGLVVIEAAFLYFWQLVEDAKSLQTREEGEQNVYVIAAWLMFGVLGLVGILHGEGVGFLVLRFSTGLLLFVSTNDKLAAMNRKLETDRSSGKRKSRKVRRAEQKARQDVDLHLIESKKKEQISAIDQSQIVLANVARQDIYHRILASSNLEIVEGEIVSSTPLLEEPHLEELLENEHKVLEDKTRNLSTRKVKDPRTNGRKVSTKEIRLDISALPSSSFVYEHECYFVVQQEEDFVAVCRKCDYQSTKYAAETKDPYTSAIRAGSRHCGQHKDSESRNSLEDFSLSK